MAFLPQHLIHVSSATTKGDIWLAEVTPSDEWSDGISAIATITIDNAPPTIRRLPFLRLQLMSNF